MHPLEDDEPDTDSPIVFLPDEKVFAIIVTYGAYVSRVRYVKDGVAYDVIIENEEIL